MSTPSSVLASNKNSKSEDQNDQNNEEEEEESIFTLYPGNNEFSSENDESEREPKYTPPYEVVISNLLPFGRPNLRGLLSYEDKKDQKVKSSRKNSVHFEKKPRKSGALQAKKRVLNVTETIYYATLNHSSPEVIPIFTQNLVQECVQETPVQAYQCFPHFNTMPNSSKLNFCL